MESYEHAFERSKAAPLTVVCDHAAAAHAQNRYCRNPRPACGLELRAEIERLKQMIDLYLQEPVTQAELASLVEILTTAIPQRATEPLPARAVAAGARGPAASGPKQESKARAPMADSANAAVALGG